MKNPYNFKSPISERNNFFGRSSLISKIYSRIGADRPQSISVVGDPKIGKSSLLWYLSHEETKRAYLKRPDDYIYFYMPIKAEGHLSFKNFYASLSESVFQKSKNIIDIGEAKPSYDLFKRIVERFNQNDKKVILFFDDFHLITQNETFPLEFFSFLRSLANNFNLAYVTSSFMDLQKLCVSKDIEESPFFNIFTNLTLKPFEQEEALQLIEEPFRKAGLSVNSESELIIKMAGLFPYTLQAACSILFEIKVARGNLDGADLKMWEKTFYEEVQRYFSSLWQWFNEDQKEIFQLITNSKRVEKSKVYVLNDLVRRNYIVMTGDRPQFYSPVFKRFILEINGLAWSEQSSREGLTGSFIRWLKKLLAIFREAN